MQRYFSLSNDSILISTDDLHHIVNVMRGKIGDEFEVVHNKKVHLCSITSVKPFSFDVISHSEINNELNNKITLFYALSKGDKNEFVMQKATELGVSKIVLVTTSRCINKMSNDDFNKKQIRFNKIIKEAAEQSKRNVIPEIVGVYNISNLDKFLCNHNFVAYEDTNIETSNPIDSFENIKSGESVSIFIGSEGGLSIDEVKKLNDKGFKNISLGKRILRTETAAVYALSLLGAMLEF